VGVRISDVLQLFVVAAMAPINARELTMIESGSMPLVSASYFLYYFALEKVEVNLDHNE
jgi:hypothetical protein